MAGLSSEERMLAATGKIAQIKPTAKAAPAATPAAPASAPAAVETPAPAATPGSETVQEAPAESGTPAAQPEGASPGEGEHGSEGKAKRFRFSTDDDQAVAQLAKSRGISLVEAARIYAGDSQPAPAAPTAAAEAVAPAPDPVVVEIDGRITEAQQRLTALTADRDAATDDLDHKKANQLSDQIAELKADVRLLENEKKGHVTSRQQESQRGYQQQVNASRDAVFTEFPVFSKVDSMERMALDAFVERAIKDPARKAEFADPTWPAKLARQFAEKQGIKPAAAGPAPAAPAAAKPTTIPKPAPQQVAATVQGAKLLTGADGRSSSAPRPLTRETALEMVRTDPTARKAIMRQLHSQKTG